MEIQISGSTRSFGGVLVVVITAAIRGLQLGIKTGADLDLRGEVGRGSLDGKRSVDHMEGLLDLPTVFFFLF
jgi:ABC-type antimicrobial peptide transport system permease subunit